MNLFDLYAKISLDTSGYEDGIEHARSKTEGLISKLGSGLATAAKAGAVALGATTTAVAALTKASVDGYAEYEQLTGGVETLFKASADAIMQYANNAYKTAGMSANQYMETVTSFSASLLQGLEGDTAAAAEYADMAITDMADNANKMGTSIEMIQNAYQGFAKQNYTMLDNLKLGYGGTAEEMARLVNESGVLGDAMKVTAQTVKDVPFDQMILAIHTVQTEMGITGTTAIEASGTIQGSVSAMRAAWTNLVTGIADENANLDVLIGNFVESVGTAADNLIPRVQQILAGVGQLVTELAPIIAEEVPKLVTTVLPAFLEAGAQLLSGLITGIITALPALVDSAVEIITMLTDALSQNIEPLTTAAMEIILALGRGLGEAMPQLVPAVVDLIGGLVSMIIENIPQIIAVGLDIILGLAQGLIQAIPNLIAAIPQVVTSLIDGFKSLLGIHSPSTVFAEIGVDLIDGLLQGISDTWGTIVEFFAGAVEALTSLLAEGWEGIKQGATEAWEAIGAALSEAWETVKGLWEGAVSFFSRIWSNISGAFSGAASFFGEVFSSAWDAVTSVWDGAASFFKGVWEDITGAFDGIVDRFRSIGGNIVGGLKDGILGAWDSFKSWVSGKVGGIVDAVKNMLGISSPSKVFAGIGQNMVLGLESGWDDEYGSAKRHIADDLNFGNGTVSLAASGLDYGRRGDSLGGAGNRGGGDTYNFYSPKALDPVSAAREMKKARQEMALGYI